ncbi:alcohol dehydrogenase catalytic domain-containing protein, partial [Mycolicibacterium baixiangningiae]|uniref:alcohol dehydrogenase catalytic domain-containing protein n=1 Tax=Mycolicibacterium baixiangningiae TaxID=2761578 RepID=UPI0018D1CF13
MNRRRCRRRSGGVCHSDVHAWHGEASYGGATFPLVPGHEFVGTVAEVGSAVT